LRNSDKLLDENQEKINQGIIHQESSKALIVPDHDNINPPTYIVPPPGPDSKTQRDIILLNASLYAIKSKVETSFCQLESPLIIMGSANLAASTIKTLLELLDCIDINNHIVNNLMNELIEKHKLIETTARLALANLDDKVAHNDYTDALLQTIEVINQHVPYVK